MEERNMKSTHHLGIIALFCLALALTGCPDPYQALVANQSSNNISSADLDTGSVTSDLGGLAIGPTANRVVVRGTDAYVVNSGDFGTSANASVMVVDLNSNTITNTIPFPDGENPWAIAFESNTKAYVTMLYGNNVTILNPTLSGASAILGTIPLPIFTGATGPVNAGPEGIVVAGGYAYTANTAWDGINFTYLPGSVSVIDTATDTLVDVDGNPGNGTDTPIFLSQINPQDLDVDAQGEIHVICTGDYFSTFGVLDVIDPATMAVTASVALGGSPGNVTIDGDVAVMGAGDATSCNVFVVNTSTNAVVHDSTSPFSLMTPSGWCTVGKIAVGQTQNGLKAYVPAGVFGAEAKLFELAMGASVSITRTFDLAPSANLPADVGLVY